MAAPDIVRVKLSSEEAGSIALTPVVVRDMQFGELLEELAAVHGKDRERIAATLKRGSVTRGATRFRWQPLELSDVELASALACLPNDEPNRPFEFRCCTQAMFTGPGVRITVVREMAEARRLFHRNSFWSALLQISGTAQYVAYSYRERADTFQARLSAGQRESIRRALQALKNQALARRIHLAPFETIEFIVTR